MIQSGLISVIIPTYNSKKYILECVESVLSQTYKNIEIIIINDGSTDNTEHVLEKYIKDLRVNYFKKTNEGPASARNYGISKCSGEYIAFIDSDDIWIKDKLQKQINFLFDNKLDVVSTDRFVMGGNIIEDNYLIKKNLINLIKANWVINSSSMVKTEILLENKINESNRLFAVEDYELWLRLMIKGYKFGFLNEKLIKYRLHSNQISSFKNIDNLIYLYKISIYSTNNILYKILLIYMYVKIHLYKYKIKNK